MTSIMKRIEERADMQIPDDFFGYLNTKLNESIKWSTDRKIIVQPSGFKYSNEVKSYYLDNERIHKVTYQEVKLQGKLKEINFTEESEKYVERNPSHHMVQAIIKSCKKDLDWISIANQCFQKSHNNPVRIIKTKESSESGALKFNFEIIFSQMILGLGEIEARKWKFAKSLISKKITEQFFPTIYKNLDFNLKKMAKKSESYENKQYKKAKKAKQIEEKLRDFKNENLYGNLDQKIKDKEERERSKFVF